MLSFDIKWIFGSNFHIFSILLNETRFSVRWMLIIISPLMALAIASFYALITVYIRVHSRDPSSKTFTIMAKNIFQEQHVTPTGMSINFPISHLINSLRDSSELPTASYKSSLKESNCTIRLVMKVSKAFEFQINFMNLSCCYFARPDFWPSICTPFWARK